MVARDPHSHTYSRNSLQPRQKKWTQDFTKLNCCLKNANNYLNLSHNILYDIQVDVRQLASSGAPIVRGYPSMDVE